MKIELLTEGDKVEYEEMKASQDHCRKIKHHFNKTKGTVDAKKEQHTSVPMSFWKLVEALLMDDRIK